MSKFWRRPWLDDLRRRISFMIFVQNPQDLMPIVSQSELLPPLQDEHLTFLVDVLVQALNCDVRDVANKLVIDQDRRHVLEWPGEHYRLLAGFSSLMAPTLTVEIGTWQGAGSAVKAARSARVVTFDIVPQGMVMGAIPDFFTQFQNVTQVIGDLIVEETWNQYLSLFSQADLVFMDGPKDGMFEPAMVPKIVEAMRPGSILLLDDIRFAGMQKLWTHGIPYPRIDLGSFGHFSGTGVVFR